MLDERVSASIDRGQVSPYGSPETFRGATMSDLDLLQGTLDVLVLRALTWEPRHGYAVARWIKETSDEALLVEDRALYVALHRLEKRGCIAAEWGLSENNRKARYYRLTAAGRQQLRAESARWTRYAEAVFKVLRAPQHAA
jgi:PadR family transcriptional regulator, regulatory protein PadR